MQRTSDYCNRHTDVAVISATTVRYILVFFNCSTVDELWRQVFFQVHFGGGTVVDEERMERKKEREEEADDGIPSR